MTAAIKLKITTKLAPTLHNNRLAQNLTYKWTSDCKLKRNDDRRQKPAHKRRFYCELIYSQNTTSAAKPSALSISGGGDGLPSLVPC